MSRLLALDVGTRRTGVAYADEKIGIPLPRDTLKHQSFEELLTKVLDVMSSTKAERVIIGLPLLPSGKEGSQSDVVRIFGDMLENAGKTVEYLDERYTSFTASGSDGDAAAACAILEIALSRNKR